MFAKLYLLFITIKRRVRGSTFGQGIGILFSGFGTVVVLLAIRELFRVLLKKN